MNCFLYCFIKPMTKTNDTHNFMVEGFLWYWGLNSELCACQAENLPLELPSQSFFSGYFGDCVSQTICQGWP
jgi:hypothetical protein